MIASFHGGRTLECGWSLLGGGWSVRLLEPFSPRELVIKTSVFAGPAIQNGLYRRHGGSGATSPGQMLCSCAHIDNRWRWTPLKNGELEVEVVEKFDVRLPYIVWNARRGRCGKLCQLLQV